MYYLKYINNEHLLYVHAFNILLRNITLLKYKLLLVYDSISNIRPIFSSKNKLFNNILDESLFIKLPLY